MLNIPCGRCMGCKLERARQAGVRCMHEARLYEDNCFVTLTYDEDHLPYGGTLVKKDLQLFCKRLRDAVTRARGYGYRFYACGEYGEGNGRPHYHLLLFNLDFHDKKKWSTTKAGNISYRSEQLERFWKFGHVEIGEVNFESCCYVARYCTKVMSGKDVAAFYDGRLPEFMTCSLKPGIGREFYDKFKSDIYPNDFVLSRGVKSKPPRYYDKILEKYEPDVASRVRLARVGLSGSLRDYRIVKDKRKADNTPARLAVKAEVRSARLGSYKRSL